MTDRDEPGDLTDSSREPAQSPEARSPEAKSPETQSPEAQSPEEWARLRRILEVAIPLGPDQRQAVLDQRCGDDLSLRSQLESLIDAHDAAGTFIDQPALAFEDPGEALVGTSLGPYRLDGLLGRGGMGTVYLAQRADRTFEKSVAVKLLRPGLDTVEVVQRFRRERQILANLEHPNIARLIDGGTSDDGRPYLVMEYVDGEPIDRFCDQHRLPTEERLRLFSKVCAAVRVAHQNLVIHRDLKPSNILITPEGEPKLLDFGIAKLLDRTDFPVTQTPTKPGSQPMTPEYASPEQLRGAHVTTASDVYSLGVLLYQLLTGRRPIPLEGLDRLEQIQALCEAEPVRPSLAYSRRETRDSGKGALPPEAMDLSALDLTERRSSDPAKLRRRLAGDLDTILLKALHKQPERRYSTVESFSRDLQQHLAGHPVSARPDSWSYRARKLVSRHKPSFAIALAAAIALVVFTTTLWLQRNRILREQLRANEVAEFMIDLFETSDPYRGLGERMTVREVLLVGADKLESDLGAEPEIRATVRQAVGRSMINLALYQEARPILEQTLQDRRDLLGDDHPSAAETLQLLADLDIHQGDYRAAEGHYREALELRRAEFSDRGPEVAASLHGLAVALDFLDQRQAAEDTYRDALAVARRLDEKDGPEVLAQQLDRFAAFLRDQDAFDEALSAAEEAIAIRKQLKGENHPTVALSLNNLAVLVKHLDQGRAEDLLRQAEEIQRRAFSQPHSHLALTLINLGGLLRDGKRLEEARNCFEEAAEIQRTVYRGPHPRWATTLDLLAGVQADLGDLPSAIQQRREVLAMRGQMFGEGHVEIARSCNNLAKLLAKSGQYQEAETLYGQSLEIIRSTLGERHRHVAVLINNLGEVAAARGELARAQHSFTDSVSRLRATVASSSPLLAKALANLGDCQRRLGDLDGAEASLLEALEIAKGQWTLDSPRTAEMTLVLAAVLNDRGDFTQAESSARQALQALRNGAGLGTRISQPSLQVGAGELQLGRSLLGQGRTEAAAPLLRSGLQILQRGPGATELQIAEAERAWQEFAREPHSTSRGQLP